MEFLSLSRRRSSTRNVPSDEERAETDVFAGYLYHVVHGDLSVADDKIIYRNCLVIPPKQQSEVLERIYDGH